MGCINIPELQKMTEKSQKMNGKSTFTNLITYRALSSFSDVFPAVFLVLYLFVCPSLFEKKTFNFPAA